jgi:diguanylate cyclase (GGDEF)-like protein/PAS domain S-box-containing protein
MVEEATSELARSEERFRALVQDSTDIIVVIDADGRLRYVSPAGKTLFGANVDRLLGSDAFELIHPDDRARAVEAFTEVRRSGRLTEPVELRARRANGDVIEIEAVGTNLLDNPAVGGLVVNVRDISERKRAQAELAEAQERFRSAFEHAPIGMGLATTDARIIRTNQAFAEMLGRSPAELVGTPIFDITDPDDLSNRELMRQLFADEISNYKMEKRYLHADGHPVWASLSVSLVRDADGKPLYMIGQVEDVTERKAIGERLAHQAIHDPLTGLPNRVLFVDRLRQALERAKRVRQRVAVLFLDLDRFKVVNDSLGHATGDRLLVTIADRLRNALRPADTVARFGGDEFTVLCDDVADESTAMQLAERMLEAVARPVNLAEGEVFVTASIGIAVSGRQRRGTEDAETLLRDADAAMYRAKDQGRACSKLFDVHAHTRAVDHLRTANALHRALERREFRMHFQPVLSLETGRITGFEGLLRWQHPERGLVPPGDFIGLAEESGLIVPIGAWALEEACRQTARWQALRGNGQRRRLSISVNLSMRQLAEPLLPEDVERTLERTGLAADALWLEITETTLMHDAESAISALRALRALGVHLAVDDFGTGYSSLTYLKRFPVEALKVDQAFVDGLGRDAEDTAIVTACVSLAHALGLTAVAEGVETPVQLAELRTLGCELAQGYLFGAPQPASALGDRPADDVGTWAAITSGRR